MPSLSSTSLAAFHSLDIPELEREVLLAIEGFGAMGGTNDEISAALGIDKQSITPRIAPLLEKGLVFRASDTRAGKSGKQQKVTRAIRYAPTTPLVIKPKKERRNPFLEGMMFAAKIVKGESDLDGAKRALKRELLKVATK